MAPSPAPPHSIERTSDRLILKSRSGWQTVSMLDGGRTGLYYDVAELLALEHHPDTVVLLGLGGGEMLRAARRASKTAALVGVESDVTTAVLAQTVFDMNSLGAHVVVADAAVWIAQRKTASVDLLLVDVYDDAKIPARFTEQPFLEDCTRALAPGGVFAMNIHDSAPTTVLVADTLRALGLTDFHVYVFGGRNTVVTARRP